MLFMALTLALFANGQRETGIRFDLSTIRQILALSKKGEQAHICYAFTWCGPCRLCQEYFPLKKWVILRTFYHAEGAVGYIRIRQ